MCGEKHAVKRHSACGLGITPACAGKRRSARSPTFLLRDHPRMCGEKQIPQMKASRTRGSPPHVRGKAGRLRGLQAGTGITPACAGKRKWDEFARVERWDHPRMCGEKVLSAIVSLLVQGSPPHVRGKVIAVAFSMWLYRITPACAGKRLKRSRSIVPHAAIVPLFPSVCNKPAGSDGSPAGHDAPPFLPIENAVPASPAYNLRSL